MKVAKLNPALWAGKNHTKIRRGKVKLLNEL
jgi:hypothetical protein